MSLSRSLLRSRWLISQSSIQIQSRHFAVRHEPPSFPTVESCPSPSCSCAETPVMPEKLPIEHGKPLNGTMAAYAEQVLICTGKNDWTSRIEEENSGDNLAADLKELMGRGGIFCDPYHNVVITNSSLPSTPPPPPHAEVQNSSVYLFPSFKYVPFLPRVSFGAVEALVQGYLLPTKLHPVHDGLSPIHRDRLTRKHEAGSLLKQVTDVTDVVVLICGHGGRDQRCGIYGPLLQREFEEQLQRQNIQVLDGPVQSGQETGEQFLLGNQTNTSKKSARVGVISHIGGHKFAGNVIIYIPPTWKSSSGQMSTLAGKGIWYGRVEPKHVEGIIEETIFGGNVIRDMFRGGIDQGGKILRL